MSEIIGHFDFMELGQAIQKALTEKNLSGLFYMQPKKL